jgi:GT2 family glycosyltransferase
LASCYLKVKPHARGIVYFDIRMPLSGDPTVSVRINDDETHLSLCSGSWETAFVPARADSQGLIEIQISSQSSVPHERDGNHDFRRLGCAVRQILFVDDRGEEHKPPQSISVVVPTYNRKDILQRTLEALSHQSWPDFEVIVVDDGSRDGTSEQVKAWREQSNLRYELRLVRQENAGAAQARNLGLRHASGDLVLFIGDDTIPESDLIEAHIVRHRRIGMPCAVVGFTDWDRENMHVTPFLEHINTNGEQFGYGWFNESEDLPFTALYTSNVSLPRWILGQDPFCTDFAGAAWEDTELGYRLSMRGLRITYCADARTHHHHPMTLKDFLRRQRSVGKAVHTLVRLHPELASNENLPPSHPPTDLGLRRLGLPLVIPILDLCDRAGITFSRAHYSGLALWAYFEGLRERRRSDSRAKLEE